MYICIYVEFKVYVNVWEKKLKKFDNEHVL